MVRAFTAGRRLPADVACRVALLAAVGWLIGYAVLTALSQDSPDRARFVGDIVYLVPIAACAVAAAVASRRLTGRHRRMWLLLAVAFTAQLAGECVWAGYDYLSPDGPPEPSIADLCYLTASSMTVVAVLVGFGGAGRLRHLRGLLDTMLIILSSGAMGWRIFIGPQLSADMGGADLVTVAYPVLDIVLLCGLGIVGIGGHRGVPASVRLVGLAGALNAGSDMVYTYLSVFSDYSSGSWVDVGFQASAVCSVVAAVVAVRLREPAAQRRAFDRGLTVLPVLTATLACFALVIVERSSAGTTSTLTLTIVGLLFLAVLGRQYLFVADRAALADQLRQAVLEQQRLAVTDGLTGLYNRRFLTAHMAAEDDAATAGPVSLLVIDLDHFKRINDTHGHPAGDAVLRESADRIAATCRASDVVARYGGEEFVVLCPDTGAAEARELAERIRRRIAEEPVPYGGTRIPASASIGIATRPRGDAGALMIAADQALYRAKAAGRDRVDAAVPAEEPSASAATIGRSRG